MKIFYTLIVIPLLFAFTFSNTNTPLKVYTGLDDVINALHTGSTNTIARYIDNNVELSIFEKSDHYSKAQSVMILKDFFGRNDVVAFDVMYRGNNNGCQFCIGTLHTRSGKYRTTIFMRGKSNSKQSIKEIIFQPL